MDLYYSNAFGYFAGGSLSGMNGHLLCNLGCFENKPQRNRPNDLDDDDDEVNKRNNNICGKSSR